MIIPDRTVLEAHALRLLAFEDFNRHAAQAAREMRFDLAKKARAAKANNGSTLTLTADDHMWMRDCGISGV